MSEQKFGGEHSEGQKEETLKPEEIEDGLKVTWTKEAIDRSYGDEMDAALVREGEILTIVGKYDPEHGVIVKRPDGSEFPARVGALKKV